MRLIFREQQHVYRHVAHQISDDILQSVFRCMLLFQLLIIQSLSGHDPHMQRILTPVIVFDYDHGFAKLKERYPHHLIYSANSLFPEISFQMEKYFQIIAAYVTGLTNKLNISETDVKNDQRLLTLFSTSAFELTKKQRELDRLGLIKLAEDAGKPVLVMA